MANRLTDTGIWGKKWFRKFPPAYKLLWQYLKDNCNHAGIWDVDLALAEFQIGDKIGSAESILNEAFKDRIISIQDGNKWFLPSFIEHQYKCDMENLNPENKVHKSVIDILKKEGLYEGLASPMQGAKEQDKDKDKKLDKEKEQDKGKPKDLNMVIEYFKEKGIENPESNAQKFFDHYEANGWYRGKTKIKSWKHCLSQWDFSENEKPKKITYTYECPDKHMKFSSDNPQISMYCRKDGCRKEMIRLEVE